MSHAPTSRLMYVGSRSDKSRLLTLGLFATLGSALAGCGADQCLSNTQFYEQKVWAEVVATSCIKCHAPEGVAAQKNSKFLQNYAAVGEPGQTVPGLIPSDAPAAERWPPQAGSLRPQPNFYQSI